MWRSIGRHCYSNADGYFACTPPQAAGLISQYYTEPTTFLEPSGNYLHKSNPTRVQTLALESAMRQYSLFDPLFGYTLASINPVQPIGTTITDCSLSQNAYSFPQGSLDRAFYLQST
jgi:hypothetical protein